MRNPTELEGMEIAVPASVANIGVGLDTLAVAVRLYLRLRIAGISASRKSCLDFHFCGRPLRGQNYIERAFRFLAPGVDDFPGMRIEVDSEIPMQSGLGSSAAAIVAGFRLYEALYGEQRTEELLTAACQLEGHADNAAAALLGGLTVCCQRQDGSVHAFSLLWPESLCLVVVTPELKLSTHQSRAALPQEVPLADAVSNLQRVLLLIEALRTGEDSLVSEALQDRLHQPFRQALVPGLREALDLRHPGLLGVFLSGAGPSVVALARENRCEIKELLSGVYRRLEIPCETRILNAHSFPLEQLRTRNEPTMPSTLCRW